MTETIERTREQKIATEIVLGEVARERDAQDGKWGEQNHPDGTDADNEGLARIARTQCQSAALHGRVTWTHVLREEVCEAFAETDTAMLRAELIQVAAVAVAWVEAIDRRPARQDEEQADA